MKGGVWMEEGEKRGNGQEEVVRPLSQIGQERAPFGESVLPRRTGSLVETFEFRHPLGKGGKMYFTTVVIRPDR